jgi:hypothetical protein
MTVGQRDAANVGCWERIPSCSSEPGGTKSLAECEGLRKFCHGSQNSLPSTPSSSSSLQHVPHFTARREELLLDGLRVKATCQ